MSAEFNNVAEVQAVHNVILAGSNSAEATCYPSCPPPSTVISTPPPKAVVSIPPKTPNNLAFTGADVQELTGIGATLLVAGVLVALRHRRQQRLAGEL